MPQYHSKPSKGFVTRAGRRVHTDAELRRFRAIGLAVLVGVMVIGFVVASIIERQSLLLGAL